MAEVKAEGIATIMGKLEAIIRPYPEKVNKAILQEAYDLQAESQKQCPVEFGRLRASAYVKPTFDGGVQVGYGTIYAVYVHERTELHHTVGKAKYLEDPLNVMREGYLERLKKRIEALG